MATTIIKTLGNGGSANGYDYGDFNAFAAAVPTDLVAADQQWILEVDSTHGEIAFTAVQTISGKTVDSTRNIIIRAKAGKSFSDHANKLTNALRYNAANGAAITTGAGAWAIAMALGSVARIEGLQIKGSDTENPLTLISGASTVIDGCIVQCGTSGYSAPCLNIGKFVNSVAYATNNNGYESKIVGLQWNGSASRATSSVIYSLAGGFTAILQNGGDAVCRSLAIFGCSTLFSNGGSGGSVSFENSATNLATMAGTGNVTSLTASSQFENVAALGTLDLRVKTGSALIGAGIRDQTHTADLDILKQTRSTTTPTIGAFEYGATAGGTNASDPGGTGTSTGSGSGGTATGGSGTSASDPGGTGTSTGSGSGGTATGGGSGTFAFDAVENNSHSGALNSVAVNWTWLGGSIGAITSITNGSGTITSSGMTVTGLPAGAGVGIIKDVAGTAIAVQEGTVA